MKWIVLVEALKKMIPLVKKGVHLFKKLIFSKKGKKVLLKEKELSLKIGCNVGADHFAYTVQQGDTLKGIAAGFGAPSARNIMACNNIQDPEGISTGQVLQIPFYYYTVKDGDTVYSIALMHQIFQWDLWAIHNGLKGPDYKIHKGQKLKIWI